VGGGGVIILVVALGYLIWYRVALGWLFCRKVKSSPVGGCGGGTCCPGLPYMPKNQIIPGGWRWCGGVIVLVVALGYLKYVIELP
jgi:hypothetical protein